MTRVRNVQDAVIHTENGINRGKSAIRNFVRMETITKEPITSSSHSQTLGKRGVAEDEKYLVRELSRFFH